MMRSRRASVLFIALIVLLLLIAGVAVIQKLSLENVYRSQTMLLFEDGLHRADGIIEILISRFKRDLAYSTRDAFAILDSAEEGGIWDGRRYELGWEVDRKSASAPHSRMWVWVRFPDDRPLRTHRFELNLRLPAPLAPQPVIVTGATLDSVDPRDATSRQAAAKQLKAEEGARQRAAALAEAWTDKLEPAPAGETPRAFALRAAAAPAAAAVSVLEDVQRRLTDVDRAAFAADRLAAARSLFEVSKSLARRWLDLARFELAGALLFEAEFVDAAASKGHLREALALLDAALQPVGACCGEAKVAWRWANLKLRLRSDPQDAAELAETRRNAIDTLLARGANGFFHRRTDIDVRELAPYLEQLWQARSVASVKVGPSNFLLVSVREDGTVPIVHAESATPIDPYAWTHDGGSIVTMTRAFWDADDWRWAGRDHCHLRLPVEGLEPVDMEPDNGVYPGQDLPETRRVVTNVELSEDDKMTMVHYVEVSRSASADYRYSVPNAWFVRGRRRMSFRDMMDSGPYAQILTLSPRGERMLNLSHNSRRSRPPAMYLLDSDAATAGRYRATLNMDTVPPERGVEPQGTPAIQLAEVLPVGAAAGALSWERFPDAEWLAYPYIEPTGTQVWFYKIPPAGAPGKITEHGSPVLPFDAEVNQNYQKYARMGKMVRAPAGYLMGLKDSLYLVPIPTAGGGATVPPAWPVDLAGRLKGIGDVCAPPWGETAFFTARQNDEAFSLYTMNLRTGKAQVLLGPGGVMSRARDVGHAAVSPLPVSRAPARLPLPQ